MCNAYAYNSYCTLYIVVHVFCSFCQLCLYMYSTCFWHVVSFWNLFMSLLWVISHKIWDKNNFSPTQPPLQLVLLSGNPLPIHCTITLWLIQCYQKTIITLFILLSNTYAYKYTSVISEQTHTHTKWCTAISTWLMQLMTFNVEISFFWCISEEPDDELYDDCAATFIPNGSSGPPPLPSSPRSPQHSATQLGLPPPPPLPMSNSSGTLDRDTSPNPPPSPGGQRKG